MSTPYQLQGPHQFWQTAAQGWPDHPNVDKLYQKKFDIDLAGGAQISTAGSCFAQNLRRELIARNCNFHDAEPAPVMLIEQRRRQFGFELFSARYGNIYTSLQLRQLVERAFGVRDYEDTIWEHEGRFYDVFRPTIEPNGFESAEEVTLCRESHLRAVKHLFETTDVLIFTFGLTEVWRSRKDGLAHPVCPGVAAGTFDADKYELHNATVADVVRDFEGFMEIVRAANPGIKFVLTVSPVPMIATATNMHVVNANSRTKSTLRAAADELYQKYDFIDYFPGYEVLTTPLAQARLYADNKRAVTPEGVTLVMDMFFAEHGEGDRAVVEAKRAEKLPEYMRQLQAHVKSQEEFCDELLLQAEQRAKAAATE